MRNLGTIMALPLLCLAVGTASAQQVTPAPDSSTAIPEKTAPGIAPRTDRDQRSGTTSDKLSDTKGVITPTGPVDPAIEKPTLQAGSIPIIKPSDVAEAPPSERQFGVDRGLEFWSPTPKSRPVRSD